MLHVTGTFRSIVLLSTLISGCRARKSSATGEWRVGVIGAGVSGAAAAHFLRGLADERKLHVKIDVFERKKRAGGRALAESVAGSTRSIEIGASMMIRQNKYMHDFATWLNLEKQWANDPSLGSTKFAVWDGFPKGDLQFLESDWSLLTLWNIARRWGPNMFFRLRDAANSFIEKFHRFYTLQEEGKTFESATAFWQAVFLWNMTQHRCTDVLKDLLGAGSEPILNELAGGLMRNNYNQKLEDVNALVCFTALAPLAAGGSKAAFAVKGGNMQIPAGLLARANVTLRLNTMVSMLREVEDGFEIEFGPALKGGGPLGTWGEPAANTEGDGKQNDRERYDAVIVATPYSFDGLNTTQFHMELSGKSPADLNLLETQSHRHVHVTFAAGWLKAAGGKGFPNDVELNGLRDIFIPDKPEYPSLFNSIGRAGVDGTGRPIWKFFSENKLSDIDLQTYFESSLNTSDVHRFQWRAYPEYPNRAQFPELVWAPGLFYGPAVEYGTSAMEVMAVAAHNVALLTIEHLVARSTRSSGQHYGGKPSQQVLSGEL